MLRRIACACVLLSLSLPAVAQSGPWTEGELIVISWLVGVPKIYRVVPETGATSVLATPQYWGGWSGMVTFDGWRGGVLANISMAPDNPQFYRLWLIAPDGTAAAMPGFSGSLRALCTTGDGRVFFIRHGAAGQGPQNVEYYDANDQIQVLKQADGVTPFQMEVEHLLYDTAGNALIGSSSGWWSATDCTPAGASVYRIPLSADGLRVDGPVTCNSITSVTTNDEIMTLDHLPDGNVLATIASGTFPSQSKLVSVNPFTLGYATWADPLQGDIDGGVWSARVGSAVVHAGGELHTFQAGDSLTLGGLITTSQGVGGWPGYGPADDLFEVDLNGPGCDGFQIPYGTGLAGKGGWVPLLGLIGCPDIGQVFTLSINSVVGGANGVLFVGLGPASVPFKGGTFLVAPTVLQVPVVASGAAGVAGAGSIALPAALTDPVLAGINLYLQAGFADAAAVKGVSLSNGLQFQGN